MKCDICGLKSNYNGSVCLVDMEFHLCKKHYLGFCRSWASYKKKINIPKTLILFTTHPKYSRKVHNVEYQLQEWYCLDYVERNKTFTKCMEEEK